MQAEDLGIYSLPSTWKSKSVSDLRRFDSVDLAEAPLELCGSSRRFAAGLDEPQLAPPPPPSVSSRLRIIVKDKHGNQKPVVLGERTLKELLRLGNQKLRLKPKPFAAETPQGAPVCDEMLLNMVEDAIIVLR